jgi:DNA-binding transcriptional LysR family regulator
MTRQLLRHPLQKVDVKLLVCLDALLAERQVSRAAATLGLDQPAMSSALARLRELFGDPLFTRVGQGMVPTPRAIALAAPVRELLRNAELLVQQADRELTGGFTGSFRLVCGADFIESLLLPRLIHELEQHMPRFQLSILPPNTKAVLNQYASGEIDLGIGYLPDVPPALHQAPLFEDEWAVVYRSDHPLFRRGVDAAGYARAVHLQVSPTGIGTYSQLIDKAVAALGLHRSIGLTIANFDAAPPIAAETHLVATLPASVAKAARRRCEIEVKPTPFAIKPLRIFVYWHETTHRSSLHKFVRTVLRQQCSNLG